MANKLPKINPYAKRVRLAWQLFSYIANSKKYVEQEKTPKWAIFLRNIGYVLIFATAFLSFTSALMSAISALLKLLYNSLTILKSLELL